MDQNIQLNTGMTIIDTNRALDAILSNFSEDFITNMIQEAIGYKFRPFGMPLPNYPYLFEGQFNAIKENWAGSSDPINIKREETYMGIINMICKSYNLSVTSEINYEHLWSLCYTMYQIFVSEFTPMIIGFFSDYINQHTDMIISGLTEEQRAIKTNYSKQIYTDPNKIIMYENIEEALEMVASLDISFEQLLTMMAGKTTAGLICTYVQDNGDIYKHYYASYIRDPFTRTDMITTIKTRYMDLTIGTALDNISPTGE